LYDALKVDVFELPLVSVSPAPNVVFHGDGGGGGGAGGAAGVCGGSAGGVCAKAGEAAATARTNTIEHTRTGILRSPLT
jgi:hypothetical protein